MSRLKQAERVRKAAGRNLELADRSKGKVEVGIDREGYTVTAKDLDESQMLGLSLALTRLIEEGEL
jgi:hypothetical protein